MRLLRLVVGLWLVLIALVPLGIGAAFWWAQQHRDPNGDLSTTFEPVHTGGYAIVVPDVGSLVDTQVALARLTDATVRVTADREAGGAAFVGVAPRSDVDGYLAGVARAEVTKVRFSPGTGGTSTATIRNLPGDARPEPPQEQAFWLEKSVARPPADEVEWAPDDLTADAPLALVVMNLDGSAPLDVQVTAAIDGRWLDSVTWAPLALGGLALAIGLLLAFWPGRDPVEPPDWTHD